ncbi:sensitive to high expression protein 9, mitochondrial [Monosporozyma unispora]
MLRLYSPTYMLMCKNLTQHVIRSQSINCVRRFHPSLMNHIENDKPKDFHQQLHVFKQTTSKYVNQFNGHFNKIKVSLREANKKIAEQEREAKDNKLNYNKDNDNDKKIEGLPSERELKRKQWSRKMEFYMDSLQETLFTATRALNDVTGYSSIQQLRNSITSMEKELDSVKEKVKEYKEMYNDAIHERIQSQREVNDLLQRKNSWSSNDLERFTQLYKDDTINSKRVEECKSKLNDIEIREDQLNDDLYRAILTRYHEEQIWSDKIRRTSTWGTFILLGINICLFLILQLLLEPWKRRRLTRSFEDKVKTALEQYSKEQENSKYMTRQEVGPTTPAAAGQAEADVTTTQQDTSTEESEPLRTRIEEGWRGYLIDIKYTIADMWSKFIAKAQEFMQTPIKFTTGNLITYFLIVQMVDKLITLLFRSL